MKPRTDARCARCEKPLGRRRGEPLDRFTRRRHCDMACARGHGQRGTKLSADAVRFIRTARGMKLHALAAEFSVSRVTVSNIRARRTWAWLED